VCITNFTASPDTGGAGFGGVKRDDSEAVVLDTDSEQLANEIARTLREMQVLHEA